MPQAEANGIRLEYESLGDGEPVVLIMGIGAQMVHWPEGFLRLLTERGYRVIRFDNRDTGASTHLSGARVPGIRKLMARWALGRPLGAPYTLSDMAADVAGLLDHLGIARAHVLGISMGGMVAQTFAIEHPSRTLTLTSVMSTTGDRLLSMPRPRALGALLQPAPRSREEAQSRAVEFFRTVGGPAFAMDEADLRHRAGLAFDRGVDPRGFLRHMAAILASGSRRKALRAGARAVARHPRHGRSPGASGGGQGHGAGHPGRAAAAGARHGARLRPGGLAHRGRRLRRARPERPVASRSMAVARARRGPYHQGNAGGGVHRVLLAHPVTGLRSIGARGRDVR